MDMASLALRDLTAGFDDRAKSSLGLSSSQSSGLGKTTLRRCRTREQGTALMTIGHAIEYLLDSWLMQQGEASASEREALAILLTANLNVYLEGAEVITLSSRLRQWFHGGAKTKIADATS